MRLTLAFALLTLVAACGRKADGGDTAAARADTGGMAGMTGMGGMMSGAMMDSMAAHMRSMDTAGAPTIEAMMPMQRQMAANMIEKMNSEMRGMNMPADAAWSALMDSVQQDLARIPEMSAAQMKAFLPAHHGRLTRLMQSHRAMMKM